VYSNEDYLIELLVEAGHMTAEHAADVRSKLGDEHLLQHFLDQGDVSEGNIAEVTAAGAGTQVVDLLNAFVDPVFFQCDVSRRLPSI
jgi:hypothetical protein